jgi:transcriptional regulator with XRE-family HTH domain
MGGQKTRDTQVMRKIGARLRTLRRGKNITQKRLAEKAGLSTSQIARLELGRLNTTISTLVIIARSLDTDLIYFFQDFRHDSLLEEEEPASASSFR